MSKISPLAKLLAAAEALRKADRDDVSERKFITIKNKLLEAARDPGLDEWELEPDDVQASDQLILNRKVE